MNIVYIEFATTPNCISISKDCKGEDIDVSPLGIKNTVTNESATILKYPYQSPPLHRVIEIVIEHEPYSLDMGGGKIKLLSCGKKELGVNLYTYFWNGERVDPFQYNNNQIIQNVDRTVTEKVNQIAVQGSGNVI